MSESENDAKEIQKEIEEEKEDEKETSVEEKEMNKENDDDDEKDDNAEDQEEEEDDDEELPPGLLEQPLEVSGKREKKTVERLSASMSAPQSEKKKVEIEAGSGTKLGDIPFIEHNLERTLASDLKSLHRVLFSRIGSQFEIKKNIRQFCGFEHEKDSSKNKTKLASLTKMSLPEIKNICTLLGVEKKGTKQEIIDRLWEFLEKPEDKGLKIKEKRKKKTKSSKSKPGKKRKRETKKPTKKKKKIEESDEENDDDDEDEAENEEEEEEEEEEDSEVEEPKKKKSKLNEKKKTPKKKVSKQNGKKEKAKKSKKSTPKSTPKKKKAEDLSDLESSDADSDDEPISKSVGSKKHPPSNDEIKKLVKKILDGADLESVTMKTVVKQVYEKYPTFDLSDKKDFIKNTVREVIS